MRRRNKPKLESFAYLEPFADGLRNYQKAKYEVSAEEMLVDRAQLLTLNRSRDDGTARRVAGSECQL